MYDKATTPNGILAAELYKDSVENFPNGKNELTVNNGALEFKVNTASWCGFTIAYKGDRAGGDKHTYIFEADFTYNGGVLCEGGTDKNICFAGLTTGNEVNQSLMNYNYISYTDTAGTALSWHGVTLEKGKTYNIRIILVAGVEYHFYVDNVEISVDKCDGAGADPDTFAGFGFYFRKLADDFSFIIDNVFMANIAPTVTIE